MPPWFPPLGSRLRIRRARSRIAERLTRLAYASKRHWGDSERTLRAWRDALTVTPEFVRENRVYCAWAGHRLVGFYALVPTGESAELEHLWVDPDWIGRGVGRLLFLHALGQARAAGLDSIELSSDPRASGFYERMGCRRVAQLLAPVDDMPRFLPRFRIELEH